MQKFAYDAPAEIYSNGRRVARKRAVTYRRFTRSAEGVVTLRSFIAET